MSLEDTELTIGGTKLRGVWIAIVLSIGTTLAGGIWAVAEFYGRIESENDLLVEQFKEKIDGIDKRFNKIDREIDDLWRGLDAAANPLQ